MVCLAEFTELCQEEHRLERDEAEMKSRFADSEQKLVRCCNAFLLRVND